jgi:copper(I)-binding protein
MKTKLIAILVLALLLVGCGGEEMTETTATGELTVDQVTAILSLPSETGAVYMRISNGTAADDALIGVTVPGCGAVELHEMTMVDDVMTMRQVEGNRIPIPAGQTVMLERGGLHVMCLGKTGEFSVGQNVPLTLEFETAGAIEAEAEVVDPGEIPADMGEDN